MLPAFTSPVVPRELGLVASPVKKIKPQGWSGLFWLLICEP